MIAAPRSKHLPSSNTKCVLDTALVKERFLKLDSSHIEYVLDCLRESTADIRNIKAYLLEMLFNAPATCGSYYRAKVNHDFHDSG